MKKILLALSVGFISIAAHSNCVVAQNSIQPVAFNNAKDLKHTIRDLAVMESPAFMGTYVPDEKKINNRALKDFESRFNNALNTQWYADKNGFVSYFVDHGYGDRAYYDKKGRWQYSLIFYGEDRLPKDIRTIVRSTYFDMDITLVEEVQTTEGMAYVIQLQDKSSIKILKVSTEGAMETMQDMSKQ